VVPSPRSSGTLKLDNWTEISNYFIFDKNIIFKCLIAQNFDRTREEIRLELNDLVKSMIEEFYQPEVNNLVARST
jgi:hypothetical protein